MNAPLRQATRHVDAVSATYAGMLRAWLERAVRAELVKAQRNPSAYAGLKLRLVRGAKDRDRPRSPEEELRQLMIRFGFRRMADAAEGVGATFPGTLVSDAIAGKPIKIKLFQEYVDGVDVKAAGISDEVKNKVRESVRQILADAEKEPKKPTLGQVVKRIATTIHAVAPEDGPEAGKVYVFSFERAEVIARTELAQVENTGKVVGFAESGIETMEWLSYSDGLSGDRHHERLNGTTRAIGDTWTDGLGNELRYPGDPLAAIASTANCRCTVRPAREER